MGGTVFASQVGRTAEPVSGATTGRGRFLTAEPAAGPRGLQRPAADAPREKPPEEPLTVLKSGPDHIRVVYRLKNCPATQVHQDLQRLFQLEGGMYKSAARSAKGAAGASVGIVPDAVTNSLLISGAPEAVEEVRTFLGKLDQPPPLVQMEVEIGLAPIGESKVVENKAVEGGKPAESARPKEKSSPAKDEPLRLTRRPDKMETTAHVRLMTLDNQPAFVQMGSRVPRVSSMSVSATGNETRSTTMDNVGLIVGITPRIDPEGTVVMQIDVEQGQVGPESEGIPITVAGGKLIRSPRMETTTIQTTVRIHDAQTMILGSIAQKGKSDKELVIIVTPHVLRP
jgi:type II secretory pathway component HofQ